MTGERGEASVMRKLIAIAAVLPILALAPARAEDPLAARAMSLAASVPYPTGTDLAFVTKVVRGEQRTYVLASSASDGLHVVDITDPEAPVEVAVVPCSQSQNDVAVVAGGNIALMTSTSAAGSASCRLPERLAGSVAFVDISDIEHPALVGGIRLPYGAHTITAHPTLPIAYVASQALARRLNQVEILDFSAGLPSSYIAVPMPPTGSAAHDISFSADGTRAYVAAVTVSYIWDTTDPLAPVTQPPIAVIADPTISIHHQAEPTPDGDFLLISDEQGGGALNPSCPGGGIHVFDISSEAAPVKTGVILAELVGPPPGADPVFTCTAHVFGFSTDGTWMAAGWYDAGTRVFDLSDLHRGEYGTPRPTIVRETGSIVMPGSTTWTARPHPTVEGYVVATDLGRGLDIYRYERES